MSTFTKFANFANSRSLRTTSKACENCSGRYQYFFNRFNLVSVRLKKLINQTNRKCFFANRTRKNKQKKKKKQQQQQQQQQKQPKTVDPNRTRLKRVCSFSEKDKKSVSVTIICDKRRLLLSKDTSLFRLADYLLFVQTNYNEIV